MTHQGRLPHRGPRRLALARRRARLRKKSGGAAIFIVAMTLGLLAAMGIYGMAATATDIRSAGHMREALQGQRAAEAAVTMTAETFNPSLAAGLVDQMRSKAAMGQSKNCRTAAPYTGSQLTEAAEACLKLDTTEMLTLANNVNPWVSTPFTAQSFGAVPNQPFVSVEVTNPVNIVTTGSSAQRFTQVTVTVFVEMKPDATSPAESVVAGRGRMTVGPISLPGSGANY